MKEKQIIAIGMLLMLFFCLVPSSQARSSDQTAVEAQPTLNSDLYMGIGGLIFLLILLFIGFSMYEKEAHTPEKQPRKRKRKVAKKALKEEEPVEEKPVPKKAMKAKAPAKKKAIKVEKTYTSNNIEIVELTRREKGKRTKKQKSKMAKQKHNRSWNDPDFEHHRVNKYYDKMFNDFHKRSSENKNKNILGSEGVDTVYRRKPKKAKVVWFRNKKKR